jgi:uncharacterized membrane protein YdjX (TVP38/TMEM64 family)
MSAAATFLTRPHGDRHWDGILRGTGVMAALGIPMVILAPASAPLLVFVVATMWTHGPLAVFMPAAYEPILAHFGGLYPPVEVAALGTLADLLVEYVDYHVFRALCSGGRVRQALQHAMVQRAIRWFNRAPFLTTFVFALTPLPDSAIRLVAPVAGYPVGRYLLAMGLGRFPNFLLFAAAGTVWHPDARVLVLLLCLSLGLGAVLVRRQRRAT